LKITQRGIRGNRCFFWRVPGQNGVRGKSCTSLYPGGSVLRTFKTNEENHYRYGYQGQFSEEDEETGWNSFELRMLDTKIGRWLSTDPESQYSSPYVAFGNNPINIIDPDGGFGEPTPKSIMSKFYSKAIIQSLTAEAIRRFNHKLDTKHEGNDFYLEIPYKNLYIGDILFDLNGETFEVRLKHTGNQNAIDNVVVEVMGMTGEFAVVFMESGWETGHLAFKSKAQQQKFKNVYMAYSNKLTIDLLRNMPLDPDRKADTWENRELMVQDILNGSDVGTINEFIIDNVREAPSWWDKLLGN